MRSPRRVVAILAVTATVGGVAAVAGASTPTRPDLPPASREKLAKAFEDALEPLGLRTTRAGLQRLRSYEASSTGRHLAVYVEPIGDMTPEEYATNLITSARIFLPLVFDRWSALKSFDVCLEPVGSGGSKQSEPPPVTQLQVTRTGAAGIDWDEVTLASLFEASALDDTDPTAGSRQTVFLYVSPALDQVPEVVAARAGAAGVRYIDPEQ